VADADPWHAPGDFFVRLEEALSSELRLPPTGPGWRARKRNYELLDFWWKLMRAVWSNVGTQAILSSPQQFTQMLRFKPATFAANFKAVWPGPWGDFVRAASSPRSLKLGQEFGIGPEQAATTRGDQPLAATSSASQDPGGPALSPGPGRRPYLADPTWRAEMVWCHEYVDEQDHVVYAPELLRAARKQFPDDARLQMSERAFRDHLREWRASRRPS
jgi:hypothetical protein